MKQVLVIANLFPPIGGGGVQRTLKFVKYLPGYGWHPFVITSKANNRRVIDHSLAAEIPEEVIVHRTNALGLPGVLPWRLRNIIARWMLFPDEHAGWIPFALKTGQNIFNNAPIQAVYSTSPPVSNHLIAKKLVETYSLPWIADFRDPYIGNIMPRFPTQYHRAAAERLERAIVQRSALVLTVGAPMQNMLQCRYTESPREKFISLPNGYDPDDFLNGLDVKLRTNSFNIVYTGTFYSSYITPDKFLSSLRNAIHIGDL